MTPKLPGTSGHGGQKAGGPLDTPATTAASETAPSTSVATDGVDLKTIDARRLEGPNTIALSTVPGIQESFPLHDLSLLDARGLAGQAFMLDGGSLKGLGLRARRVSVNGKPGFEISGRLTSAKLGPTLAAFTKRNAKPGPIRFDAARVGDDGVAQRSAKSAELSVGGSNMAPDTEGKASEWAQTLTGPKGGTIELVGDKAPLAVRGLLRLTLSGSDAECTEQLGAILKTFGIGQLFSPPTAKSKQVNLLMHALWQGDHAKAEALSENIDKLSVKDVEDALIASGYDRTRIDGLRYEEVFEGHFTPVDPAQADAMVEAGARYLYSTVDQPDSVLAILKSGQKSSYTRYRDGVIVEGMSTNQDFNSGGAVGVFTRLVTNNAIYDKHQGWRGRTYKLVQTHDQLARTDWHGWNGDYYGRRWNLTQDNFGPKLAKAIGSGSYAAANELIFTEGNRPENIARVVATKPEDRSRLIDLLRKAGYEPHNGLSIEDFVVLSPDFMVFGPSAYKVEDPKAFIKESLDKAKNHDAEQLKWLLVEGPPAARAATEEFILTKGNHLQRRLLYDALAISNGFALPADRLDRVLRDLANVTVEEGGVSPLDQLLDQAVEPLFLSDSPQAQAMLTAKRPDPTATAPYGLSDTAWVRIIGRLTSRPAKNPKADPSLLDLAVSLNAKRLLQRRNAGFIDILQRSPLVRPKDPNKFIDEQMAKLPTSPSAQLKLQTFIAQAKDRSQVGALMGKLMRSGRPEADSLLQWAMELDRDFGLDGPALSKCVGGMNPSSAGRQLILHKYADLLLRTGDPKLLAILDAHHGDQRDYGIKDTDQWLGVLDHLATRDPPASAEVQRALMERGGAHLVDSEAFRERLSDLAPYEVTDAPSFVAGALDDLGPGGAGHLKLAWSLLGAGVDDALRTEAVRATITKDDWNARKLLGYARAQTANGALPLSGEALSSVVQKLAEAETAEGLDYAMYQFGEQIVRTVDDATLDTVGARVGDKGLAKLGINYKVLELLEAFESEPSRKQFVLKHASQPELHSSGKAFIAYLRDHGTTLADLGRDRDWAARTAYAGFKDHPYRAERTDGMMAGPAWLLNAGGDTIDAAMLEALEAFFSTAKTDRKTFKQFVQRIDGYDAQIKRRLQKARGGLYLW